MTEWMFFLFGVAIGVTIFALFHYVTYYRIWLRSWGEALHAAQEFLRLAGDAQRMMERTGDVKNFNGWKENYEDQVNRYSAFVGQTPDPREVYSTWQQKGRR